VDYGVKVQKVDTRGQPHLRENEGQDSECVPPPFRMRIRLALGLLAILLLAGLVIAAIGQHNRSRIRLSRLLSWDLPKTVTILNYKGFDWEKDPRWYWSLSCRSNDLAPLMADFWLRDHDELVASQRELEDVFIGEFKADPLDRVYYNEIQRRSVAILLKPDGTNAYVAIYSR
jgi:hypothetical protein